MISTRFIAYMLSAVTAVSLAACSNDEGNTEINMHDSVITVSVATPSGNATGSSLNVSGQVESKQTANISTRVMGYINRIYVNVGDHVKAGQMLVSINSNDLSAKRAQADAMIAQAQAALAGAQKDYDRFTALYKRQSATAKELDNVTLQYKAAQAGLEAAKQMRNEASAQFSYANITAPFSGIVTQKLMDAGSMASPGIPILTVEQSGSFQVTAAVPESEIGLLKQGSDATMQVKSTGKTLHGKVSEISRSSQFTGGQYLIKINLPGNEKNDLYAGMYVNVSIPVAKADTGANEAGAVLVPKDALIIKDQLTGVYTISAGNTALLRWVRLGHDYGDKVEVLSGLSNNEKFITHADGRLYNGAPVKIREN